MNTSNLVSGQMPSNEILSDLSDPSSPDSVINDYEILGGSVNDEVTSQLAASGRMHRSIDGHNPYNLFILTTDYSKNFTTS